LLYPLLRDELERQGWTTDTSNHHSFAGICSGSMWYFADLNPESVEDTVRTTLTQAKISVGDRIERVHFLNRTDELQFDKTDEKEFSKWRLKWAIYRPWKSTVFEELADGKLNQ